MSDQEGRIRGNFWSNLDADQSLQQYQSLVNMVDEGVYQLDADGHVVAVNDLIVELTGYAHEDLLGAHVSLVLSEYDVDRVEGVVSDLVGTNRTGRVETIECPVQTADKKPVDCEHRLTPSPRPDEEDDRGVIGVLRCRDTNCPDEADQAATPFNSTLGSVINDTDNIGVFVLDSDFHVAWTDETIERYFGVDREASIGRNKRRMIEEEIRDVVADPDEFEETVLATYDDNTYLEEFECRITPDDGCEERWLKHLSKPIDSGPYDGGRIEIYYDVTEQHRHSSQLRRLNEAVHEWIEATSREEVAERACTHLADILNLDINGIFLKDESTGELQLAAWTDTAARLFDHPPTFTEKDSIAGRVFETGEPAIYDDVTADPDVYNPDTPIRSEIILPIGDHGVVLFGSEDSDAFDNGDLNLAKIVAATLDVTFDKIVRQQRLEARAAELETELAEIYGRITDGFIALNEAWEFTHVNERAEEILGVDEEVLGTNIWETFPEVTGTVFEDRYREAMTTQEPVSFEEYYPPNDAWYEEHVYPSETGVSVYFRDVSARRERERELEKFVERLEESNERLEQFAYAASHDLQEPLRMVSSYLQLLQNRYAEDFEDDAREFIDFAVDGAERMREMIDGLLEYSRVETRGDPFEPVDLDEVLVEAKQDLRMKIQESDATVTAEWLPRIEGDASQLRQVFQNVLDNAIVYSGEDPPQIHVSAERTDGEWVISVRDEGIGIDPDDADRVFEVFQRLHTRDEHAGTGIGLALCKRIIERHGGEIWMSSDPGEETTVSFTLPALDSRE